MVTVYAAAATDKANNIGRKVDVDTVVVNNTSPMKQSRIYLRIIDLSSSSNMKLGGDNLDQVNQNMRPAATEVVNNAEIVSDRDSVCSYIISRSLVR